MRISRTLALSALSAAALANYNHHEAGAGPYSPRYAYAYPPPPPPPPSRQALGPGFIPGFSSGVAQARQVSGAVGGVTGGATGGTGTGAVACNNSPELCSRSYSEIVHLGAHDSPFVRDVSTGFSASGNQFFPVEQQLSAGVRLISGQAHNDKGTLTMCHSSCDLFRADTLTKYLTRVKNWLDQNPNEVVTFILVNSDDAGADQIHQSFTDANLVDYAWQPPDVNNPPATWPTLADFITAQKRLLVFVASLATSKNTVAPYLMDEFVFLFENPFGATSASNLTCQPDRPTVVKGLPQDAVASKRLPMVNHFIDDDGAFGIQTPNTDRLSITNGASGSGQGNLEDQAAACTSLYGRKPTFFLTNFFNVGPAINVIDRLNGISDASGRLSLPATTSSVMAQQTNGGVSALKDLVEKSKTGQSLLIGAFIFAGADWEGALGFLGI